MRFVHFNANLNINFVCCFLASISIASQSVMLLRLILM